MLNTYGLKWGPEIDQLQIELFFIKNGGYYTTKNNVKGGEGLSQHMLNARRLIWPELDDEKDGQRWHKLCRDSISTHRICVLLGPGSSGKTHEAAWYALVLWMANPQETCVLASSTDMRGLRMRVWGELTSLWEKAVQRFDYLPGHLLDSKLAITYENLESKDSGYNDRTVRDFRSAIVGIPTIQNGRQIGLSKWIGVKQKNIILLGDEFQFMGPSMLSAFSNLNKNENFRAILLGNPCDTLDPLGKAAEPIDGWANHMSPEKTCVWQTRFMNGLAINLIGTDSPALDFPEEENKFPYLINRRKIAETKAFFSENSYEFESQCLGRMRISALARRVISRALCEQNHALDQNVVWRDGNRTRIYACDAAWGGDRCVGIRGEFGQSVDGKTMLLIHPPSIIPLDPRSEKEPEEQIAIWIRRECESNNILPQNFAHDSTGRGSLGTFLARVWSAQTNPIEFGGPATDRPVSLDHYTLDPKTGHRRLRLCREQFSRFVAELWFSVRYCIESGQLRGLTEEVMDEGCQREWSRVKDDRLELETKTDMKERIGKSPDLFDALAILVEIARRRGFQISKLANEAEQQDTASKALEEMSRKRAAMLRSKELNYACLQ